MKKIITPFVHTGLFLLLILFTAQIKAQTDCHAAFGFHPTEGTFTINFTDSSTSPHEITSWSWDFGDGTSSTEENPSHTYDHDGTYYVCLTIHDDHGCSSTACHYVTIDPVETEESCHAAFGFHQTEGTFTINLTDSSTSPHEITSWYWDFGDGHSSTEENPSHTYDHDGTYYVCLTIHDDHGCSSTACHHVTVHAAETEESCYASFGFHPTEGTFTINFTDSSTSAHELTSWYWDFGDGHTSTEENPSHTYDHYGTYYVCLTIHDDHGCSSTACHHVTVHAADTCHGSFTFHIDSAGNAVFANTSTGTTIHTTYSWDFGDGTSSTEENPDHTYEAYGDYTVCLYVTDTTTGCSSHSCHTITYHHPEMGGRLSNYPNPFSSSTTIQYELSESANITIEIYDVMGNRVTTIANELQYPGLHTQFVNADNLNSGFYIIRMNVGDESFMQKISVVK